MSDGPRIGATGLATRFVIYYALTYLVLIGLMGFIFERTARDALIEDVRENLEVGARLASESLPEDSGEYPSWAEAMFEAGAFRFTLIDKEGVVLADSHSDPKVMENHADRPEVEAALAGDVGSARRVSASTGFDQLYVALPPESGLIVRASVPTRIIDAELSALRGSIIFAVLTVGLVGVFVVALVARRTVRPVAELTEQSRQVAGGRLDVSPPRSRVSELDQLGLAISSMADTLGSRIEEAEQATATLETVLAAIPQGTILIDRYDKVIYASQAALELLGSMPVDLGGLSPLQLQIAVREARATESTDTRFFDHGNPARRIRAVATPFSDERVLLVVVDVTDRERTDSIRRDFVANASHELKTPVSTIIASSEAMQIAQSRGDQSAMTFASRIEESARQLNRLVGDLLDLSRLEREELERGPVRLDLVARDEVERVRVRAEEKDLSLDLDETELTVDGSHRDLAIALRNLLDNALRYTTEGGTVTVSVLSDEEDAVVRVTDSGEGIPTRDRERVFERFYRVDSARSRETGGTGLGLSIVKHVAESHGGSVELESELGVGSTFIIRLPLGGGNREDG
jgi:two-component system phosphate regulon sensor histidine kinase PhoR